MSYEHENRPVTQGVSDHAENAVDAAKANLQRERSDAARREFGGWLTRMRENPFVRRMTNPLFALFLGVPLSAGAAEPTAQSQVDPPADATIAMQELTVSILENADLEASQSIFLAGLRADHERDASQLQRDAFLEASFPETDEFYRWELGEIGKKIEGGEAAPEYYARVGRPEWSPYQRSLFADEPVQERFTELHPEYRGLSNADFLDAYPDMLKIALSEFRFSNQYRFLTEDAERIFASEAPTMPPDKALGLYKTLVGTIAQEVGLSEAIALTKLLEDVLPDTHPIRTYATETGILNLTALVGPSKGNVLHMDQAHGQLRVLRKISGEYVLIDSFPAIGGPLDSPEMTVAKRAAGSEYVHVPDTVLTVAQVNRAKTSWSWHNSWVPQGAPIREAGDQLQYQHPLTGKWYDLTGPNAAFFPDGKGGTIVPFDKNVQPADLQLIRASSHKDPAGIHDYVPQMWTKDEILARNGGDVPTEWKWNDFGSVAIRLNLNGDLTNINIHSKPGEDINQFLAGRTHGCFATYGEYVQELANTYGVSAGTTIIATTELDYDLDALLTTRDAIAQR